MKPQSLMLGVALGLSSSALTAQAAAPQPPAWVAESNQNTQIVLKTFAEFAPEQPRGLDKRTEGEGVPEIEMLRKEPDERGEAQ